MRDGLFLSLFPVQSLPYFMAGAAILAIVASQLSGRLLARLGPVRVAPVLVASNAALFLVEWFLLGWQPRAAAVLLYAHTGVLGGIAISSFWSLLNERFDPHSAKPLMARVAAAAAFGGFAGGVGAERVSALLPAGALLPLLALVGGVSVAGALARGEGRTCRARPRRAGAGPHGNMGAVAAAAPVARPGARNRSRGDAGGSRRLHSESRSGRVFWTGRSAGALLRTVLFRNRSRRVADPGIPRACRTRAPGPRRIGREPRCRGGSRGPARVRAARSLARHRSPRARCRRAQFDLPRWLRASLHAARGLGQALGQVGHRRRV